MDRIILAIIFIAGYLWAIQPVPKNEKTGQTDEPKTKLHVAKSEKTDINHDDARIIKSNNQNTTNNRNDQFVDVDSNNVNDQRENDLLKIKQLKTKLKELFDKGDERKPDVKTPKKPKNRSNK